MVSDQAIRDLAARIAAEFRPERIVLFGSHATGTARPDSDVDLLVVMPHDGSPVRRGAEILARVHPGTFGIDLVLRSPEELRQRCEMGDPFIRTILAEGRVLYEAAA